MKGQCIGAAVDLEPNAVGFVLAGGRSTRMGTDKALVLFHGEPLVAHGLRILRKAGLLAYVAGGQSAMANFAPMVEDRQAGLGPLSGICAALASTAAQWAIFLPVDLPLLPPSLVICLLWRARITSRAVTVPSVNGFAQTFPAVVHRSILPILERELASGRGGCISGFRAAAESLGEPITVVPVESLVQCGQVSHPQSLPAARWFINVNTAEDLRRAEVHCNSFIA